MQHRKQEAKKGIAQRKNPIQIKNLKIACF